MISDRLPVVDNLFWKKPLVINIRALNSERSDSVILLLFEKREKKCWKLNKSSEGIEEIKSLVTFEEFFSKNIDFVTLEQKLL